jgi:transketolase
LSQEEKMSEKEPIHTQFESELMELDAQITEVKGKAVKADAKAKAEYEKLIETLRTKKNELKKKIHDKMEQELQEWDKSLKELKLKAERADEKTRGELKKMIGSMQAKKDDLIKRLSGLKKAKDDAWDDVKSGMSSALSDLKGAFQKAASKFK